MAVCVKTYRASGRDYIIMETTQPDPRTCQYVLMSGPEFNQAVTPVFQPLTISEGVAIATAAIGLFAVAAVFRALRNSFINLQEET